MEFFYYLSFIVGSAIFIVLTRKYFSLFFAETIFSRNAELFCYAIYFSITIVLEFFIVDLKFNLLLGFVLLVLISMLYDGRLTQKILTVFLLYFTVNAIHFMLVFFSGKYNLLLFNPARISSVIGIALECAFFYVFVISITLIQTLRLRKPLIMPQWIITFLSPLSIIFLLFISLVRTARDFDFLFFISIISLITINIVAIFSHDFKKLGTEVKLMSYQNQYYENQMQIIQASENAFKSLRHDLKNHLVILSDYLSEQDCDHAKEYLSTIYSELDTHKIFSNTGNRSIDSLLNYKLHNADTANIHLEYHAEIPAKMNIAPFDLTIILGNLIDNALEAVSTLPLSEEKQLSIKLKYDRKQLHIKISNTFDGVILSSSDKLLTKKQDKSIHGIGLKNVRATIAKYNGEFKITHKQNWFTAYVILYDTDVKNSEN